MSIVLALRVPRVPDDRTSSRCTSRKTGGSTVECQCPGEFPSGPAAAAATASCAAARSRVDLALGQPRCSSSSGHRRATEGCRDDEAPEPVDPARYDPLEHCTAFQDQFGRFTWLRRKDAEEAARHSILDSEEAPIKPPTAVHIARQYPQLIPKQITWAEDRFISRRCRYGVEAANYLLTKKVTSPPSKYYLEVFTQLDSLMGNWRRQCMHQLMVKENVIPGVRQKQVLRTAEPSAENKLPGTLAGQPKDLWSEKCFEDGMWKAKPRKRPLIGLMDSILDIPGFQCFPGSTGVVRRRMMDWSSKNVVVASVRETVTFYNTREGQPDEVLQLENANARCLKWSNQGDLLAIGSHQYLLSVFQVSTRKFLWSATCHCCTTHLIFCLARCIAWSQNDQHVVVASKSAITVYEARCGVRLKVVPLTAGVLTMAFSPNYRYLVSTFADTNVRIFNWPYMTPFLDISYYKPVEAVAWHPQESGLLCIGGGLGDGSLSLWNVNKMEPQAYRKVAFDGCVDNLIWNKNSGELLVQWIYFIDSHVYTIMPILGSLDRIVDALPLDKEMQVGHVMWNCDHTQIAVQADESVSIWNFYGNELDYRNKRRGLEKEAKGLAALRPESRKIFMHCNIR